MTSQQQQVYYRNTDIDRSRRESHQGEGMVLEELSHHLVNQAAAPYCRYTVER